METLISKAGKQLLKQECTIADQTGQGRLVLWEQKVGMLAPESSYMFNCFKVSKTTIDTTEFDEDFNLTTTTIQGEIVAVSPTDEYISCFYCNGRAQQLSNGIVECTNVSFN